MAPADDDRGIGPQSGSPSHSLGGGAVSAGESQAPMTVSASAAALPHDVAQDSPQRLAQDGTQEVSRIDRLRSVVVETGALETGVLETDGIEASAIETGAIEAGLIEATSIEKASVGADARVTAQAPPEIHFHSHFVGVMTMYGDRATVAAYLDAHSEWFRRCAQPMPVELVAKNSYALSLGRYGALGHALEPQICLELLPSDQEGIYRIETVPLGTHETQGYEVDFNASLHLVEKPLDASLAEQLSLPAKTDAEWNLDLEVVIHLPRFLQRLPLRLIEQTGDRVLQQIVGQVSRRLTHKVQEDFHRARNLPLP
ncbi:MAG: DUF1997 domain-containing protein [Prochlorothrix sp.]|nr:DUF1997 domain-containing protein [Prochlorothrix sp.]